MTPGQHYATSSYTEKRKQVAQAHAHHRLDCDRHHCRHRLCRLPESLWRQDRPGQARCRNRGRHPRGRLDRQDRLDLVDDGVIPRQKAFTDRVKQLGQASSLQSGSYLLIGGDDYRYHHQDTGKWPDGQATGHSRGLQPAPDRRQGRGNVRHRCRGVLRPDAEGFRLRRRLPLPRGRLQRLDGGLPLSGYVPASIRPPRPMTSSA